MNDAQAMSDWVTGTQKERRLEKARSVLLPNEKLLDSATGMIFFEGKTKRPGAMLITDRRVVLYAVKLGGHEVQDFAYSLLTTVDHSKGLTWTTITLAAAGNRARMSVPRAEVDRLVGAIRRNVASGQVDEPDGAKAQPPSRDVGEEIRTLAALRDDGLITDDEFQLKKTQLLGL